MASLSLITTYMGSREESVPSTLMPTPTSVQRGPFKKCQGQGWVCTTCSATRRGPVCFPNLKAALNHERTSRNHGRSAVINDEDANEAGVMRVAEDQSQTLDKTCWDRIDHAPLTSEGLRQWEMHAHVDQVFDLVPFWQRSVHAAEHGEVLRLEEFLDKMEGDGGWRTAKDVLEMLERRGSPSGRPMWSQPCREDGGWESNVFDWPASQRGGWGVASNRRIASDATESSRGGDGGRAVREEWAKGQSDDRTGGRGNAGAAQDGWAARARVQTVRAVRGDDRREELHHFVDAIAQQQAVNEERRKQMHLFFEMPMEKKIQKIEETIRFLRTHTV